MGAELLRMMPFQDLDDIWRMVVTRRAVTMVVPVLTTIVPVPAVVRVSLSCGEPL
jgi:hypothetical protein